METLFLFLFVYPAIGVAGYMLWRGILLLVSPKTFGADFVKRTGGRK